MAFDPEEIKILKWVLDAEIQAFDTHKYNLKTAGRSTTVAFEEHYRKVVALRKRLT